LSFIKRHGLLSYHLIMKRVNISGLKAQLSAHIQMVRKVGIEQLWREERISR